MGDQLKLKPQRKDIFGERATGLMEPQPGTVAVGDTPYPLSLIHISEPTRPY